MPAAKKKYENFIIEDKIETSNLKLYSNLTSLNTIIIKIRAEIICANNIPSTPNLRK